MQPEDLIQLEQLTDKEREITEKIVRFPLLKGKTLSMETVYWATKLASLVDTSDPWTTLYHEDICERLRDCLYFEARARALPKPDRHWEAENIEALHFAHWYLMSTSTDYAHRAAEIAAEEIAMKTHRDRIDTRALVQKHLYDPTTVLRTAYEVLAARIELAGPHAEKQLSAQL